MSEQRNNGGPAFPAKGVVVGSEERWGPRGQRYGYHPVKENFPGMSLRDWFAGQALAGLLAHTSGEDPDAAPRWAYKLADAMLAERQKP